MLHISNTSLPGNSGDMYRGVERMKKEIPSKDRPSSSGEMNKLLLKKQYCLDDPINEALTSSQMSLLDNEQTWLYHVEGTNPNEVVNLSEWLSIRSPIKNYSQPPFLEKKSPGGGFVDSRTFLRPRKHANSYSRQMNAFQYTELVNETYTYEGRVGSSLPKTDVNEAQSLSSTMSTSPYANRLNGTRSRLFENSQDNYPLEKKTDSPTKQIQLMTDTFDFDENLDRSLLEDATCPSLNNFSISGISKLNSSPPSSRKIYDPKQSTNCSNDSLSQLMSPEGPFKPTSVSTPTASNEKKNHGYDNGDSFKSCLGNQTITLNKTFKPINPMLNRNYDSRNPTLSKSDPSILDSVECVHDEIRNVSYDRDNHKDVIFSQIKSQNATYIGSEGNLNIGNRIFTHTSIAVCNEEDNASSASDSSYCSSTHNHIRSLGDVRSVARLQEESLRMQPLERNKTHSRNNIVRSQELIPKMKKVLSEDGINTNSSENQKYAMRPHRAQSSLYSINNNMVKPSSGTFIRPPRYNLTARSAPGSSNRQIPGLRSQEVVGNKCGESTVSDKKHPEINQSVVTSKIVRSRIPMKTQSRIPAPSQSRVPSTPSNPRKNWRDGCY